MKANAPPALLSSDSLNKGMGWERAGVRVMSPDAVPRRTEASWRILIRMTRRWWKRWVLAGLVMATGLLTWQSVLSPRARARRRDAAIYAPIVHYPGADRVERRVIATGADSCFLVWCDHYYLHVAYRLPPGTDVEGVKRHYRSNLPSGWKEADDSACAPSTNVPPGATPRTGHWKLIVPDNRLLLENSKKQRATVVIEPPALTLRPAEYSCYPDSR